MSVMLSAASCLRWFCRLCSVDEKSLLAEIEQLDEEARNNAPLFLPYLSGERTPHNDPYATGVFHGLTPEHQRAALGYAVLEGVAFGMVDGLDALRAAGTDVAELSLVARAACIGHSCWPTRCRCASSPMWAARPVVRWVRRAWPGWPMAAMKPRCAASRHSRRCTSPMRQGVRPAGAVATLSGDLCAVCALAGRECLSAALTCAGT
jgi:hypothetical protein